MRAAGGIPDVADPLLHEHLAADAEARARMAKKAVANQRVPVFVYVIHAGVTLAKRVYYPLGLATFDRLLFDIRAHLPVHANQGFYCQVGCDGQLPSLTIPLSVVYANSHASDRYLYVGLALEDMFG